MVVQINNKETSKEHHHLSKVESLKGGLAWTGDYRDSNDEQPKADYFLSFNKSGKYSDAKKGETPKKNKIEDQYEPQPKYRALKWAYCMLVSGQSTFLASNNHFPRSFGCTPGLSHRHLLSETNTKYELKI